jgi:hypothetical protein
LQSVALVTPVHGRVELTRLVMEQRARLLVELAHLGVEAKQVIVGDDENLASAREHSFDVLERPNVLGFRINEGLEFAFRELEVEHACYVGSDDWLLAEHLADVPTQGKARASRWVAFVSPDGRFISTTERPPHRGAVPWTLSRELLEPVGYRPARDDARRLLDSSILAGIGWPRPGVFEYHAEDDPLRCVDFKSRDEQLTPWRVHASRPRRNPFEELATRYPVDLVERMEEHYRQ